MGTTHALMTFEEFERLPETDLKQELVNGELIELPPPEYTHHLLGEALQEGLKDAIAIAHRLGEGLELGRVHHDMGYLMGGSFTIPDVSITHASQDAGKYLIGAPAIAIEVVPPSNTARILEDKRFLYFAHGAREVWHFYPQRRYVAVFTSPKTRVTVTDAITTPLLPGCALSVAQLLDVK